MLNPFEGINGHEDETINDSVAKRTSLDPALQQELQQIVESLSARGKGILTVDDSIPSMEAAFREMGLENTETARRDYRQMLLSADKVLVVQSELSRYISGVVLNHETLYQKTTDKRDFIDLLRQGQLIPGIKVDKGSVSLFGTTHEETTEGLDSLQERCIQYKKDGCHFAAWRCTYKLSDNRPSNLAIEENARVLARFATIAQSARLVALVEPEILTTGEHELPRALQVHEEVLSVLFRTMMKHHVFLEGIILKPGMVLAGIQNVKFCKPQMVADFTLTALRRTVPSAVPTIMFLDDRQSDEDATLNLNAISTAEGKKPWNLSFCYGRALHNTAAIAWSGDVKNIDDAQLVFLRRAKQCSEASEGTLNVEEFEKSVKSAENFELE